MMLGYVQLSEERSPTAAATSASKCDAKLLKIFAIVTVATGALYGGLAFGVDVCKEVSKMYSNATDLSDYTFDNNIRVPCNIGLVVGAVALIIGGTMCFRKAKWLNRYN